MAEIFFINDPEKAKDYEEAKRERRPVTAVFRPDVRHLKKVTGFVEAVEKDEKSKTPRWRVTISESKS
jgi:hypothetical protein